VVHSLGHWTWDWRFNPKLCAVQYNLG